MWPLVPQDHDHAAHTQGMAMCAKVPRYNPNVQPARGRRVRKTDDRVHAADPHPSGAAMKRLRKIHLQDGSCKQGARGEQAPHHKFVEADDKACLVCARICDCEDCCVLQRDFGKGVPR